MLQEPVPVRVLVPEREPEQVPVPEREPERLLQPGQLVRQERQLLPGRRLVPGPERRHYLEPLLP